MKANDEVILNTSDKAAKFVTHLCGWVDRHGRFWGDDERMARWSGCTHEQCSCGNMHSKGWTCCEKCRDDKRREKFDALEKVEWDGETPITLDNGDEYFFCEDDLRDYLEENEININDLQFRLCQPVPMPVLDESYFLEQLHEGAELPDDIANAIAELNQLIRKAPTQTWEPSKYAAVVKL